MRNSDFESTADDVVAGLAVEGRVTVVIGAAGFEVATVRAVDGRSFGVRR